MGNEKNIIDQAIEFAREELEFFHHENVAYFSTRKLYSNNEAMVFEYCRPIMANGITSFILTNDLADRTISVFLKSISENERRPKKDIWDEYQDKKPIILGSIYGAVYVGGVLPL